MESLLTGTQERAGLYAVFMKAFVRVFLKNMPVDLKGLIVNERFRRWGWRVQFSRVRAEADPPGWTRTKANPREGRIQL